MILPPAMSSVMPVIHEEASEARNSVAAATSSGWPMRRSGKEAASCSLTLRCQQLAGLEALLGRLAANVQATQDRSYPWAGLIDTPS